MMQLLMQVKNEGKVRGEEETEVQEEGLDSVNENPLLKNPEIGRRVIEVISYDLECLVLFCDNNYFYFSVNYL